MPEVTVNEVTVNIEVFCASCGQGLCNMTTNVKNRRTGDSFFEVEACDVCLDSAKQEGYEAGYEAARKEYEESNSKITL
jgi:hypothetical protein